MHQPRHIYASSVSRRERSWGRGRRRSGHLPARLLVLVAAAAAVLLADPRVGL
jgi:hypothetical protein